MAMTSLGIDSASSPISGLDPLRKKKPVLQAAPQQPAQAPRQIDGAPMGAQPGPTNTLPSASGGGQPMTFAQLQAAGMARPAPPPVLMAPAPITDTRTAFGQDPATMLVNMIRPPDDGAFIPPSAPPTGAIPPGGAPAPNVPPSVPGTPQPPTRPIDPNEPPTDTGGQNPPPSAPGGGGTGGGGIPPAGGGTPNQSPLDAQILEMLKNLLNGPSAYDNATFNAELDKKLGQIDDEYVLNQNRLRDNLARRGLGTVNDSTIGLGELSDLNVGKRSAKESATTDLTVARNKQYAQDVQNALMTAMGYNNSLWGRDYAQKQLTQQALQNAINSILATGGLDDATAKALLDYFNGLGG